MNKNEYRTLIVGLVITLLGLAALGIYSHTKNQEILGAQSTGVGVYIQKRPQDTDQPNADNPNIQNNQNRNEY